MRMAFAMWVAQHLKEKTRSNYVSQAKRIEDHCGDLDAAYDRDRFADLLEELSYSAEDQAIGRPNPAKFPIIGNIRDSLATYRSTLRSYARFRQYEVEITAC